MPTPHVADGVYFTVPPELPRGRHDQSRDEIESAQRERLMIAATELLAQVGYQRLGVRQIATRARVSLAAFYTCYADKDECIFAAYDRFIAVLLERTATALEDPEKWEAMVRRVVIAYLETLGSDLVVARAFQVEMDSLGRPARERRRQALTGMALALKARRDEIWPDEPPVGPSAYIGAVYAVRQLASDRLDAGGEVSLTDMADEVSRWAAAMLTPGRLDHQPHSPRKVYS